jgi:hypothetical protein
VGCGSEDLELESRIEQTARFELSSPREGLAADCDLPLEARYCAEEYEPLGSLQMPPLGRRTLNLDGADACGALVWFRWVALDQVGPVDDPGTLVQIPALVELEYGAGADHAVAFPQGIVRLDEVGGADQNQSGPPRSCAELGRDPR